ncbi:hypothetical protein AB1Y20_014228 [Prymnesium parvum]|uniref:Uncharacterized protein n=1 Tax=Prymnesium parvum TaxID=97485 RepID=A0AB34IG69_PRYPA
MGGLASPSALRRGAAAGVCLSQALFLTLGYAHQLWSAQLRLDNLHISGMLDDDRRSALCGAVALVSALALLALELARPLARRALRLLLAGACGAGILLTCHVRESAHFPLHAFAACLAFGAGILLLWVVLLASGAGGGALAAARALSVVCAITAVAQALKLLQLVRLPMLVLAAGEAMMVLGFGASIAASRDIGCAAEGGGGAVDEPPRRPAAARA